MYFRPSFFYPFKYFLLRHSNSDFSPNESLYWIDMWHHSVDVLLTHSIKWFSLWNESSNVFVVLFNTPFLWLLSRISGVMIWSICASLEEPVRIFLRDSWRDFSYACCAMDGSYLYFYFLQDLKLIHPLQIHGDFITRRHSSILLW